MRLPSFFFAVLFLLTNSCWALDATVDDDAYSLSMGGATAAVAGGTHAIQVNPAGVGRATVPMAQANFGFKPSSTDLQFELAALYPFEDGTVFALSQFSDFPYAPISNTNYIGSVAFPLNSSRDMLLGVNLKYLALSTLTGNTTNNGRGVGLDLGFSYDVRNTQGTFASFAFAVKDVATDFRFSNSGEEPGVRTFLLGAAYQNIRDTRIEADYQIVDQTALQTSLHNRFRIGAERFFDDRNFSARIGFDDLFNTDGSFSVGAGWHPAQPFEVSATARISEADSTFSSFLSFIYRFDDFKNWGETAKGGSSVITLAPSTEETQPQEITTAAVTRRPPPRLGRPVSSVPLRKMTVQVDPAAFSPGGKQKTVSITFPGERASDIAGWELDIQDADQKAIRHMDGSGPIPPLVVWDGVNDQGKTAKEGEYRVALRTFNNNNELLSDDFENVEVVSLRSTFALLVNSPYFSTRAAKRRKDFQFTIEAGGLRAVHNWEFEISESANNKVVYSTQGESNLPRTLAWNGRNLKNQMVSDGNYYGLLIAEDKAGNPLKTDTVQLFVNNTPPDLTLKGEDSYADFGKKSNFRFTLDATDRVGFTNWKLQILDEKNKLVKEYGQNGNPPTEVTWDGKTADGTLISPGAFVRAEFSATDKAGNQATTEPFSIQSEVSVPAGKETLSLNLATVYFDNESSDLSDAAKKELAKSADSIKQYLDKSVLVLKGYAAPDETGDTVALSRARAQQVRNYLMGIVGGDGGNVYAIGYSTKDIINTDNGPAASKKQRRVLVTLYTK